MKYRYSLYVVTSIALAISFAFAGIFVMQTNPQAYGVLGFLIGMATSVGSFISWIENKIENRIILAIQTEREINETRFAHILADIKEKIEKQTSPPP